MSKKGWMLILVMALSLLLAAACLAEEPLTTQEQLQTLISQAHEKQETSLTFSCEKSLFETLSDGSFAVVQRLLALEGAMDYELKYSYMDAIIVLEQIQWGPAAVECGNDLNNVLSALKGCTDAHAESFVILCDPSLCYDIYVNSLMSRYMVRAGIDTKTSVSYSTSSGLIRLSDIHYIELPFRIVDSANDVLSAMSAFRDAEASSFMLLFTDAFYEEWRSDYKLPQRTEMAAALESSEISRDIFALAYTYSQVVWDDTPRAICSTEDDIVESIRMMGAAGASSFYLILNEGLYDQVYEGYFGRMAELQSEAGMSDGSLSYYPSLYVLKYDQAKIVSDVVALDNPGDASDYVAQKIAQGETDIDLFCSVSLYEYLMGDISAFSFMDSGMAPVYDLVTHNGINDCSFLYSSRTHIITLQIKTLYPGFTIPRAMESGDLSALTPREVQTMEAAQEVAASASQMAPLDAARFIHDWLCERVVYTDDESTDEDDCAIGAILNGQANCDGYADAFYLIGTLSGLHVRYQHGDSYNVGHSLDFLNRITHLWNIIELDGSWRLIDVTWDDQEQGPGYMWFNLGEDRAKRMHIWNDEMTVPLMAETDLSTRPENEFWVESSDEAKAAVAKAAQAGLADFTIIYANETAFENHQELLGAVSNAVSGSFNYLWNDRMLSLTVSGAAY